MQLFLNLSSFLMPIYPPLFHLPYPINRPCPLPLVGSCMTFKAWSLLNPTPWMTYASPVHFFLWLIGFIFIPFLVIISIFLVWLFFCIFFFFFSFSSPNFKFCNSDLPSQFKYQFLTLSSCKLGVTWLF